MTLCPVEAIAPATNLKPITNNSCNASYTIAEEWIFTTLFSSMGFAIIISVISLGNRAHGHPEFNNLNLVMITAWIMVPDESLLPLV